VAGPVLFETRYEILVDQPIVFNKRLVSRRQWTEILVGQVNKFNAAEAFGYRNSFS
jgi:hypothetical protein